MLPENDVPQEPSEVIVEDDDIVESEERPNSNDSNDEDETPYDFFVQDTCNEPLEVDRLHRSFAWPDAESQPINEFKTPSNAAMAFVKLFPLGFADLTKPDRQFAVSETDATAHLLRFAELHPLTENLY